MSHPEYINIKDVKKILKTHKLTLKWLAEESGYSRVHMSLVFSEKSPASQRFLRIVMPIIIDEIQKTSIDLKKILRGTQWEKHFYGAD